MSQGFRNSIGIAAVVPWLGIALVGCGGSDTPAQLPTLVQDDLGVQESDAPSDDSSAPAAGPSDINALMVCDTVEAARVEYGPDSTPKQARVVLRKALNTAFKNSTTPEVTIATSNIDRLLNQGCPGERARALIATGLDEISSLSRH